VQLDARVAAEDGRDGQAVGDDDERERFLRRRIARATAQTVVPAVEKDGALGRG